MKRKLLGGVMVFSLYPILSGTAGAVSGKLVLNKDKIAVFNAPVGRGIEMAVPDVCVKPGESISCSSNIKDKTRKGYGKPLGSWFSDSKKGGILRIPNEQKYYNRHFEAVLTARAEGPIATEITIPVWIETENKVFDSTAKLEKGFGFMPVSLDINDKAKHELFIYNNTGSSRTFNVFLICPPQRSGSSLYVQSPGYEWLKEGSGIEVNVETGKKLARNRFQVKLFNGQIAGIKIFAVETLPTGQEVLLVAVPEGGSGFEFARIHSALKGKNQ